jgi:hypothetical protein
MKDQMKNFAASLFLLSSLLAPPAARAQGEATCEERARRNASDAYARWTATQFCNADGYRGRAERRLRRVAAGIYSSREQAALDFRSHLDQLVRFNRRPVPAESGAQHDYYSTQARYGQETTHDLQAFAQSLGDVGAGEWFSTGGWENPTEDLRFIYGSQRSGSRALPELFGDDRLRHYTVECVANYSAHGGTVEYYAHLLDVEGIDESTRDDDSARARFITQRVRHDCD